MKKLVYVATVVVSLQVGCKDNPADSVKPRNHSPVISFAIVFPEIVGPSDSLILFCSATDPDGDSLVYDWYSNGIVRIKGACPTCPDLYNTSESFRVFHSPDSVYISAAQDTFRLQCAARDRKGGMDVATVYLVATRTP
jgi:hypothetical protein